MSISVENKNDITLITIENQEIDASNTGQLKDELHQSLAPGMHVLLDLSKLQFIDSSGLGVLLSCMRYLTSNNGDLKICCVTKSVQAILELVRFHRVVDIFNTREEAEKAFE